MMQTLSQQDTHQLLQRLPEFELSYETIPHKKVSNDYNICLAIPLAKKFLIWFSYRGSKNCIYKLELNREKKITVVHVMEWLTEAHLELCLGTVFYCSQIENSVFIIEDVFYIRGLNLKGMFWGEKMEHLLWFFDNWCIGSSIQNSEPRRFKEFRMPFLWLTSKTGNKTNTNTNTNTNDQQLTYDIPSDLNCGYKIHHIQYRCLNDLMPYVNIQPPKTIKMKESVMVVTQHQLSDTETNVNVSKTFPKTKTPAFDYLEQDPVSNSLGPFDWKKPQYKQPTVFQVCADIQSDVYHMFTYGPNHIPVYYGIAYIPSYECSVFMNSLFRNIKENSRLDAIEESDDEEEFENVSPDKYVDLDKKISIECTFSMKFKRWIPKRVVLPGTKVVHIHMLKNSNFPNENVKKPHTNIYASRPCKR